jgi:TATA-box binding protein (TBP) (component of TFIID and TFIIIB)
MSVFQTGKIIITGGRYLFQLEEAYDFLNAVLQRHASEILRLPSALLEQIETQVRPKLIGKLTKVT